MIEWQWLIVAGCFGGMLGLWIGQTVTDPEWPRRR